MRRRLPGHIESILRKLRVKEPQSKHKSKILSTMVIYLHWRGQCKMYSWGLLLDQTACVPAEVVFKEKIGNLC